MTIILYILFLDMARENTQTVQKHNKEDLSAMLHELKTKLANVTYSIVSTHTRQRLHSECVITLVKGKLYITHQHKKLKVHLINNSSWL